MAQALASRMPRAALAAGQAIIAFPNAAFALVVAVVLVCGVGIANMPSPRARPAEMPSAAPAAPPDRSADDAAARPPERSPRWGVLEDITPLAAVADRPAEFDFTVRLRDRSVQVTRTVGRAKWRVGDRIMLMGGSGARTD